MSWLPPGLPAWGGSHLLMLCHLAGFHSAICSPFQLPPPPGVGKEPLPSRPVTQPLSCLGEGGLLRSLLRDGSIWNGKSPKLCLRPPAAFCCSAASREGDIAGNSWLSLDFWEDWTGGGGVSETADSPKEKGWGGTFQLRGPQVF